ncbi:MAG: hypothetical protein J6M15_04160 [Prevotella sp.]|nr:hypothetical protein [Prevotella sp.]
MVKAVSLWALAQLDIKRQRKIQIIALSRLIVFIILNSAALKFDYLYKYLNNKKFLLGKQQSRVAQDDGMSEFTLTLALQIKATEIHQ